MDVGLADSLDILARVLFIPSALFISQGAISVIVHLVIRSFSVNELPSV